MKSTTVVSLTKIAQMLTSRIGRKPLLLALAATLACLQTATAMKHDSASYVAGKADYISGDLDGELATFTSDPNHAAGPPSTPPPAAPPSHNVNVDAPLEGGPDEVPPLVLGANASNAAQAGDDGGKQKRKPMEKLKDLIDKAKESKKIELEGGKAMIIGGATLLTAGGAMVGIQLGEAIQDASKFGDIVESVGEITGNDFAITAGCAIAVLLFLLMGWMFLRLHGQFAENDFQKTLYQTGFACMTVGLGLTCGAMFQSTNIEKITEGDRAGEYIGKGEMWALLVAGALFVGFALITFAFMYFAPREVDNVQIAKNVVAAVTAIGGLAGIAGATFGVLQEGVHDTHYEAPEIGLDGEIQKQIMGAADHVYVFMILGMAATLVALYYLLGGSFNPEKFDLRYDGAAVGTMVASTVSLALGIAGVGWYAEANQVTKVTIEDDLGTFFSSNHATGLYFAIVFLLAFIAILAFKKCNNKGNDMIGV